MTNLPAEPSGSGGGPQGGMRASDSDRERVAESLREAAAEGRLSLDELNERLDQVFSARTYAELAPITADLPSPGTHQPAPARTASSGPLSSDWFGGQPGGSAAIAILGGFVRKGDWVAPPTLSAVAILGGGEIDLRDARFAEHTVRITAVVIMGGIQITVPEDANVQVNGIGIMGGFDHTAAGSGSPGGPRIVISGFAFWGGVQVQRLPSDSSRPERGRGAS
jgi:hypothetical protein